MAKSVAQGKKTQRKKIFWRTARNSGGARKVAPRSQSSTQRANVFFFFFFFPTDCSFDSCDGIHRKGATPRSVHYVKKFYCDVNYVKYVKYLFKYPVICLKSQEPFPSSLEGSSYWKPTVFLLQIFFGSTNLCHEILYEDHCIIIRFPGICNMHWKQTKKIAISTTNTKLERRQPNGKVSRTLNITVVGLAGFPVPRSLVTNPPPTKPLQSGVKTGNTKLLINDWDGREVTLREFASHLRRVTPFTEDSSQFCSKILSWPFTTWHQYACSLYISWDADKENLFSQSRAPLVWRN